MGKNLLRCVNTPDVDLPNSQEISNNVSKITKGYGLLQGGNFWTKYFVNNSGDEKRDFFILGRRQFNKIKNYFDAEGFDYSFEKENLSLCCEKSTNKMKVINADFQLNNGVVLRSSFIYSPQKNYILDVRAHFNQFKRQEELLQMALVQEDIDMRSDPAYADLIHCSSSFRIFESPEIAREVIDKEMFDHLKKVVKNDRFNLRVIERVNNDGSIKTKPAPLESSYDGAFIHGHEEKYRWPLTLPKKGLTDGTSRHGNLQMVCMVGGPPEILAVHEEGVTIVTNDRTDELPLKRIFNSLEGVCFDLGMRNESTLHTYYLGCCESCEPSKISSFKKEVISQIEENDNLDFSHFKLVGEVAKRIDYKVDFDNLKVNIISKKRKFN